MYEEIRGSLHFNKFEFGDMLLVEYTCPIEDDSAGIWTPMDSFIHVLSGRKSWRTPQGCWTAETGQTLYIKKGASIIDQHMEEGFCVLLLFIDDRFIADCVREVSGESMPPLPAPEEDRRAFTLNPDVTLSF